MCPAPPCGGGQVTQDPVPGQLHVGGGHGDGPRPRLRHLARQEEPRAPPTMSPAQASSYPRSGLCSQSVCWGARLTAHPVSSPSVFWPHQPGGRHGPGGPRADRARQPAVRGRGCFSKWELVPPLSTVLSVTMTQIVSTLASLLQGAWHPGHTPAS